MNANKLRGKWQSIVIDLKKYLGSETCEIERLILFMPEGLLQQASAKLAKPNTPLDRTPTVQQSRIKESPASNLMGRTVTPGNSFTTTATSINNANLSGFFQSNRNSK